MQLHPPTAATPDGASSTSSSRRSLLANDLPLVTRNGADFAGLDELVEVIEVWPMLVCGTGHGGFTTCRW
jgi:hypothetical protein